MGGRKSQWFGCGRSSTALSETDDAECLLLEEPLQADSDCADDDVIHSSCLSLSAGHRNGRNRPLSNIQREVYAMESLCALEQHTHWMAGSDGGIISNNREFSFPSSTHVERCENPANGSFYPIVPMRASSTSLQTPSPQSSPSSRTNSGGSEFGPVRETLRILTPHLDHHGLDPTFKLGESQNVQRFLPTISNGHRAYSRTRDRDLVWNTTRGSRKHSKSPYTDNNAEIPTRRAPKREKDPSLRQPSPGPAGLRMTPKPSRLLFKDAPKETTDDDDNNIDNTSAEDREASCSMQTSRSSTSTQSRDSYYEGHQRRRIPEYVYIPKLRN